MPPGSVGGVAGELVESLFDDALAVADESLLLAGSAGGEGSFAFDSPLAVDSSLGGGVAVDEELVLSREEALIAHTRSNAWLMFQEGYTGSIRPGLRADLVVLDRDYLTVPPDEIKDIRPVATIVNGSVVHGNL